MHNVRPQRCRQEGLQEGDERLCGASEIQIRIRPLHNRRAERAAPAQGGLSGGHGGAGGEGDVAALGDFDAGDDQFDGGVFGEGEEDAVGGGSLGVRGGGRGGTERVVQRRLAVKLTSLMRRVPVLGG